MRRSRFWHGHCSRSAVPTRRQSRSLTQTSTTTLSHRLALLEEETRRFGNAPTRRSLVKLCRRAGALWFPILFKMSATVIGRELTIQRYHAILTSVADIARGSSVTERSPSCLKYLMRKHDLLQEYQSAGIFGVRSRLRESLKVGVANFPSCS